MLAKILEIIFYFYKTPITIRKNLKHDTRDKFTFIIPTLWKSENIFSLLESLEKSKYVGEVLIINNSNSANVTVNQFKKIKLINQRKNIYVNPAWNLGVSLAEFNNIALCNDDIILNINKIGIINKLLHGNCGLIGIHSFNFRYNWFPFFVSNATKRTYGYGTLMFFRKNKYVKIPEDLKIFCGDDFLFENIEGRHLRVNGLIKEYQMSKTSSNLSFNSIKESDIHIYKTKYKNNDIF